MQYLTIWDLLLTPLYLMILIAVAKRQRDKRYPTGHPLRPYFLPGLYVKLGGAIFIALVYQYYYGGYSDSFNFFAHSQIINSSLDNSLTTWVKLLFRTSVDSNPELYPYVSQMFWYVRDPSSFLISAIGAVCGLLNGTTYIPIALLFAFFSYTGMWALYRTFTNIYPYLHKQLAVAFLFVPSVFVWGSGLYKDTVCMFSLGWLTYCVFQIFIAKNYSFKNISLLVLSFYLIAAIKIYILLAFLPALAFWILLSYSHRIASGGVRFLVYLMVIGVIVLSFIFFSQAFSTELNKYSLEKISKTAEYTRGYIGYVSEKEGGSGYDLGKVDGSLFGMISKFPAAVTVTLFRPFPWEAGKLIVLLSALEALVFLFFTLKTFYKNGVLRNIQLIFKDPNITFCLIFSLIFAFAVGITSYNFGSLSRYKIPCMPFYSGFLVLLLYKPKPQKTHQSAMHQPPVLTHAGI